MLDTHAPLESQPPTAPAIAPSGSTPPAHDPGIREATRHAMNEPGIFKGCTEGDGPLGAATKNAILAYLGKPNAASWERLRHCTVAGRTTLGDAWALAAPGGARRFPTSAELIRSMRVAVVAQWAGSAKSLPRTH